MSSVKEISYDGEGIELDISTNYEGWSTTDAFNIAQFQGRRQNTPKPLQATNNSEIEFQEENIPLRVSKVRLSQPGLDWGLGCIGHATKIVETGRGEATDLHWTDFHEMRNATEIADGRVCDGDDEWIHTMRLYQKKPKTATEEKSEQELIDFHRRSQGAQQQMVSQVDLHQYAFEDDNRDYTDRFLAELDDLESARPNEVSEVQGVTSAVVSSRARSKQFSDWIDEADFVEANAMMPQGTRYYHVD